MTQKKLLTSVPSAFKFHKCQLIQNQNKLSTEVKINFRKLPETTAGHIETINITCTKTKRLQVPVPLIKVSLQSLPSVPSFHKS